MMELLCFIVEKVTPGIKRKNPNNYVKELLKFKCKIKQGKHEFIFIYDEYDELGFLNVDCFEVDFEFYLIGYLKFLFVVVGRSVSSVGRCLFCKLKQSEWVSHHGKKDNGRIKCHAPLWNMEELILPCIDTQVNQQNEGRGLWYERTSSSFSELGATVIIYSR